jgi:uncharacterized membrane protein
MSRLERLRDDLRGSFWFVPSMIVAVSIALAAVLIEVDSSGSRAWMARWPRLFGAGAEGARGMLSTIAGSMMTVVGVTFSMTLVALALASSQYTSRILRTFMRDRMTQAVLGIFAGIFTYCLIVLRTIRGGDEGPFIPGLAVAVAVALAIGGVGVLILFIHHIASSIQAANIIASIAADTLAAVDRLFPAKLGSDPVAEDDDQPPPGMPEEGWRSALAERNGYIQGIDGSALLRVAREHAGVVRMERGIGEFVVEGTPLVSIRTQGPPRGDWVADLRATYGIDRHRTLEQDAAFGVRQVVDMALRALSPGINDTTTAAMCVDYLTAVLARLASRAMPSSRRYEDGQLRVIAVGPSFAGLLSESFDEIRASAGGNVTILLRLLSAVETIAGTASSPGRRRALQQQVREIAEMADRTVASPFDRVRFEKRRVRVIEALGTA